MLKIKQEIQNVLTSDLSSPIAESQLKKAGLCNVVPHDYQVLGIDWLYKAYQNKNGVILGDEMGLGKTLQSIAFLLSLRLKETKWKPCLVVTPLSVIDGWEKEFKRFAPHIKVKVYIGNKDEREMLRNEILQTQKVSPSQMFDVILTSFELCLKDENFFKSFFQWDVLIVDEAHRLKNFKSQLYQVLLQFTISFKLLLTGTPVQNNMKELYSLLTFCSPDIFKEDYMEEFLKYFTHITEGSSKVVELHNILKPFLLRRTKNEVVTNIPKKMELMVYCGMSKVQKKLYKALLMKNLGTFSQDIVQKTSLMNILMQLRKCSNHPYIFPGIEAEPFVMGEHLVESSGKLHLLDRMLKYLHQKSHKVLLFSQMTTMLDIVQDYLSYRGYSYERLDGSVRGEERFLAVNSFNASTDTFIFLLSTKAGGQGLNLMTADTVIFLDSDFNPQNDLQAAARAHRIGQKRPVKIIRLVSKDTVEEIILKRAENKLKLTQTIMEGGQFSNVKFASNNNELTDILKFGLENLLKDDESSYNDVDIESVLGKSLDGFWLTPDANVDSMKTNEENKKSQGVKKNKNDKTDNIYEYEGHDYSTSISSDADKTAFEKLIEEVGDSYQQERSSRKNKLSKQLHLELPDQAIRKRKVYTDEEKEQMKINREVNKAKRVKLMEEQRQERQLKLWSSSHYTSMKIDAPSYTSDNESDTESIVSNEDMDDDDEASGRSINYIVGDVTKPQNIGSKDAIIVHCLDDSGVWGSGGLFSAISHRSKHPREQYELSAKMNDLKPGDVHLVDMMTSTDNTKQSVYVALLVAHTRNKKNELSPLLLNELKEGLERIYNVAKATGGKLTIFNTGKYRYYYKRHLQSSATSAAATTSVTPLQSTVTLKSLSDDGTVVENESDKLVTIPKGSPLLDIFANCRIYLHGFTDSKKKKHLSRYVIAYDGDLIQGAWTNDITHVVIEEGVSTESLPEILNTSTKVVTSKWLEKCISRGELVSESESEL